MLHLAKKAQVRQMASDIFQVVESVSLKKKSLKDKKKLNLFYKKKYKKKSTE